VRYTRDMPGCGKCGAKLDVMFNQVGRRDTCPTCGAELHACLHCRHYDEAVAKECKEPFAEVPEDKGSANFCDLYQIGDGQDRGGAGRKEALISAAEALFGKK
jgi:predicted RNA-binding Zn-ribbon protein involved in translation (DUF1610 family)